ncbi:unnamed protein product [Rhodiola kirilowii]
MATTEVESAEGIPLTTMQKMEVDDKELLRAEYDQSVDQLSKDELTKIKVELTKAFETVEQDCEAEEISVPENQAEVLEEPESTPVAPYKEYLEVSEGSEELQETKGANTMDVLSASKTENDDAVREKAFEDSIEHEVPDKVLQPENSVHIQAEDSKTEKTTTDSVQVEEQIIKNICKVEDETRQAISLKDDPVVENLESPAHIIPEKIEEAETSDIAEKTIPDVEEENTINEQHTAVVEGGASNLQFVELEKAQEADTPHSNIVKDEKMERADTVQVTEEPREVEGVRVIADSSEGDIPPVESFTREVNEQSYEKKNDKEPSPTSNIERILEEEENKCEKREAIIEEVNDEPASTSIDDSVEEQTNIVGHLSTKSQEEDVTTVSLDDKKEDSSKKEISEQFTTGLSENKEVPEKSASLNDKPGVGVPESSLNSSSEKPEKVIASDDSIKISTTEEEADKIEEQGTDTITVTDKEAEKADAVQVIEEPRDVKGIHSTADSSEVEIPPAGSFNSEVIEKTCEEEKEDPTPTSNIEQLLQEEENKSEKREAINEEVNDEQTSDINYDSVKEDATGHEKDLITESHEDDVTAVSLNDEKEASNEKETSDQVLTEILQIKEEPEKSTSQNDEPELGVPKTESSSNSTSEKPEAVASENVDGTRTEELADKIDEQGSNITGYNKASDTESAREMNFTLQEANENTGVAEAKILDKDAEVKEILSTDEIPTETHKGVTDDAGKLKLLEEEKDEVSAISKIVDRTPEENIDERETGHLTSEEVVELENPYDIDLKETCKIEDAETNKEESVENSENDDTLDSSLTVTADDSSSELLLPVEINQKKTSQDEKDDEQPEQIDETLEIVEKVPVLTTAEIKEDVPGKDEDISASLSVEEPVEEVEHIVETDKEDTTREDEIQSVAEELTVVSRGDATIDVSDATEEVVTKSVEGKSIDTTVEESVVEDGSKLDELIVSESPIETHGTEEVSAQVDYTGETGSLDHMENKVETSLEEVSGSYPGDFDNLKVSKPDPAQIDETPEIVVQVPVVTPAPAEIKEDAPGKDEDKHVSLREEELVEKVEQIVETDKDDTTRECEIEGVPEPLAVVSRGDTSFIVADGAEVVTESVQGQSIDHTVNESAVEDATKLDELVVSESRIQTFRTEEVSPVVEEIEGTTSLDQMKNKVETSLGVISEPDPDDSENLEKVLERDPADSEKLKQVSEPDPDDSEKLKQVSEPDPDDSEKLKQVSEPNSDDSEKLKQVSEPDPDDSENLEKVLELTQVSELDLDESENLINISEPNPDESEILKNVSEPVPDETNILEKFSEPDPEDSENLKNASEPDPDSVNTEGTELPTSSVNDENISGLKNKNDKKEIVEDQQKHDVSVENKEAATEILEPEDEQEVKKNAPNETEDDTGETSLDHMENKVETSLEVVSGSYPGDFDNLKVSKPDPAQIDETPEIVVQVPVLTPAPAEMREDAPGKDEEKHVSLREEELVEKVEQIVETDKDDTTRECEIEGVPEPLAVLSQGDTSFIVADGAEVVTDSVQGKSIDDTVNESAVEDATKLDKLVVSESKIQTFRTEEVSPVVEEREGTTSLDQMKNKVETSLGVISEPDPDDSENLEKVLERDPADSEKLKQVSEPDPDDSEKLKQVSEPDPDDSEKLKQVSEPNPDDTEKLKQVSEPDPDDSENLEKVLELTQVSELDLDESENLINISEPNPDESEILKNVSEPVPDETNILEKFSEPDPDDSENLKNASEPDPDSVNTEGTELPTSSVNDENICGLKSKNDMEEIVEDQQKHDVSVENKEAATEVLEPEDEQEVKKNAPNETEDTDLFTSSAKQEDGKENDKLKEDENVEEALTAEEMAVQEDEQLQPDRFPNESKDNELSASNLNGEDTTILKKGTEEVQDQLSVENQPEDDDSARESEIFKEDIVQQDEQRDDDTNILEKFLEPDPDDSENQDKDDKTEIPKECDELTNKEFSVDTSEAVLEKTDEQPREITVPDKVSAASVEEETVIGSIEVIKCMDTTPELSVEDSVQEEDISSQIPEIKTEEDSEPTEKVNSQTIQERECDVEHVEESGSYETVGIVQQDDANIESQTSKGSEEVTTREIEGAEGLSPPTDASVEDDGHVGGKILLSEVLVQPNDNQGEEIEHLPSKTVNTELAASSVNDESITGLTSEEHKNEVLEEQLKDYASAENKEPATKGLEPENQHEVNESVPNETEDAELFTSSVNEKEKDQPKEEESVEENLTADEEAVQEDEQVPLDQFPNGSKGNEPYASNLNDDDTTILMCEKGPVEEVQEELPGENQPEDSENVTGSEISNEAIGQQDKQAHVGQILDGTGNLEPSVSYASDEKQASLKSEEVLDPVEEESKNDQKEVYDLEQKEIVNRELVLEVDQGGDENNEPDPDDTDILEKFSEPYPDDRVNLKNVSEPDPDDYDNKDKVDKTKIPGECDEVTTKEIPAGTNGEVLEKTDEQHRETTVPDEVSIVSRNIEVKPATDTATELSVEDSVQEEDSSSQIPEIKTEKESKPTAKDNSQTTQDPESDVEQVEESGNYETVSIVQQDYAYIEIQASEASEKVITRVIDGAEGLSPSTDVLVEDSKPNEASKDSVNKEREIENVSQVLVQPDDNQGEEIDHLPSKIEVIELATSSVSYENISGLKSEEDKEEILEEHQKGDDIAENKEAAREIEVKKNVTDETEDDGKEKDRPKEKENVEEKPTADEVALQEDEQAQPDRIPNELKDNELSGSNLNDEDTTIIKCEKFPEKAQEKQGEESVHFPTEAEGTETPASCVDSGNLIVLRDEDTQEEKNEKDQAKENETIQEIETATEVIVLEDKQGEQLKHLQSEDQEAETSAPGVNDDEIDIPKNEADAEIVLDIDQAKDEDAKEIETTSEVFELESKAVELEHLPTKSRDAEPSSEDERNTVLKSEDEPEEILHEEKKTNLAKDDIEEKENENETLGQVSDETGNLEPSVSYASDEKHASLKSVQVPEETLEDESKNYQTEVDEIEKKEIANRVLELEDVQGKDAKNEPSTSRGIDDSINTLKTEESPEDVQEQKETKGAKNEGEKERSETANEALVQGITIGKEIDLSNKIVEPEPNASTDEILILRGEEETDGPEEEEHAKDQVSDEKITANELSIEEDKKGDELEHLAKETEETDGEESKQRSKEIEDVIKGKDPSNEELGSSFEELEADSQESKNNLDKEPDIVEDSKKKEDSAMEGGSYEGTLEDRVETSILENENTKTVDEEAASTDETEITKQLLETSVVKDVDENVTIPEALPAAEDKSSEEDGKGLTETHEVNKLESLPSVEVWNSEVQNDFVETAKETKRETLESIIPVAGEEDKKDLIIVETQGEKLHGLERNDVLIQGYESQNASEFRKTNSDEKGLQTLETVDVPTPAADGQVDVTLEETADDVSPESPVLQGANISRKEDKKELTSSETGNDELKEQKGQEKYKEDITSATHEAEPEGEEEIKTEEQRDDSSSETVIEPVKLQELEANNALVTDGKNEKVAHIELGKEETKGESETKTETLSDFTEEEYDKEVKFNETPTVSLSPTDDKLAIDKVIKTEVSDEVVDKTKVSSESPQVSNREIYAGEGQQVNEAQTKELTKEVPENKLEEIKETGAAKHEGVIQDDGIKDLNTAGVKGYKVEEHNLNELDGSKTNDALTNRDSTQVVNTPSEQFDVSGIPQINAVQRELVKNTHAEATPKDDPAPVSSEAQQSTSKSLDYGEEVQPESAENSLSDLLQISTKDTIQMTQKPNQVKKEDVQTEDPKTDEDKDDEDDGEGEEHKKTDSSSDGVIVEASRDMDVKSPQKKHHGILSGVGTKVKNSISKVKKAITGKSSHPKPPSPK